MLVYANRLRVQGDDAESAVFKAIGGWLKEQLGFGLHPNQLRQDGEYIGYRGEKRSKLRIHGCYESEPALCAWVLKHADDDVQGRQWIVEIGAKKLAGTLEVSCVVKTDERDVLVSSPVSASQPRVIRFIVRNVRSPTNDAHFSDTVPGEILKTVGQDRDSYLPFLVEIGRSDREGVIVLVSSTQEGEYLVDPIALQTRLVGLAQVVQVDPRSNSYEMAEILGQSQSAWGGAVNVLSIPSASGTVRYRYFLTDEIRSWGDEQQRISRVLAWVTANTNIRRLQKHVRPEGVMLLSMRRRMEVVHATSAQMNTLQLRQALDEASQKMLHYEHYFDEIADENERIEGDLSRYRDELDDAHDKLRQKDYQLQTLKEKTIRRWRRSH